MTSIVGIDVSYSHRTVMTTKKSFISTEIDKLTQAINSPMTLAPGVAAALQELEKSQARSQAFLEKIAKEQEQAASRIAAQLQASIVFPSGTQNAMDALSRQVEETQRHLAQAAAFARARIETWSPVESEIVSRFNFPALPSLAFPQLTQIDWDALQKRFIKGVVHLADCGWTVIGWMIPREATRLGDSTDDEIESYFLSNYLGDGENEGCLNETFATLLKSADLEKWKGLLEEVSECFQKGQHRICVPALLTILEGYTAESLYTQFKCSPRETNKRMLASLKGTKRHQGGDFTSLMWMSLVVFLDHLFASSDFGSPRPTFINRHWILHGRSATDWTAVEALKLVNALATLHWLFDLRERHPHP